MSIAALAAQTRERVTTRSVEAFLRLVPEDSENTRSTQKFFAIFLTSIASLGFLALLGINTLLAQDAFVLSELKSEAKIIADQREAIDRTIEMYASPQSLSNQAIALGMAPSESSVFLDLTPVALALSEDSEMTRG